MAELNRDWFNLLAANDPAALERQYNLLRGLGGDPRNFDLLEDIPRYRAFWPRPRIRRQSPRASGSNSAYRTTANLLVRHIAPSDAEALAEAMSLHGELIDRLVARGLTGAEVLFMYPEDDAGDREYALWLHEYCQEACDLPDDELAAAVGVALIHGIDLRHRLQRDAAFREDFREMLWPRYSRLVAKKVIGPETFAYETKIPGISFGSNNPNCSWQRWGLMAVDLLFGTNPFPPDLHPQLVRLMLQADNAKIQARYENRTEPLLFAILAAPT